MTLGEKIKQARLEAGLSQRQLCGETVTRNMLSQIENGSARPSMGTLSYFAAQLGKPISYFLEEDAVLSPNQALMRQAREAVLEGRGAEALAILETYRGPDETFDTELQLLRRLAVLDTAAGAIADGRGAYAAQLLEKLEEIKDGYCAEVLERQRLLLLPPPGRLLPLLPGPSLRLSLRPCGHALPLRPRLFPRPFSSL